MARAERELDITPDLEAEIQIRAKALGIDPERLRYHTQFGPTAPTWPDIALPFWRAWWPELKQAICGPWLRGN